MPSIRCKYYFMSSDSKYISCPGSGVLCASDLTDAEKMQTFIYLTTHSVHWVLTRENIFSKKQLTYLDLEFTAVTGSHRRH
eukprot:SAG31_NODE_138_length_22877_cov_29.540917_11_plen_81_part_00